MKSRDSKKKRLKNVFNIEIRLRREESTITPRFLARVIMRMMNK